MSSEITVEQMLRQCSQAMSGTFTRQDVFAWFRRHYPGAHGRTVGTLMRAMTSNATNREKHHPHHGAKEPLFDSVGHGLYRVHVPEAQASALADQPPPAAAPTTQRDPVPRRTALPPPDHDARSGHVSFRENDAGVSYDRLFSRYLVGATEITLIDPYIRMFHQARNLMEFLETIARCTPRTAALTFTLVTVEDKEPSRARKQLEFLAQVKQAATDVGISLIVRFDPTVHDREILTSTGWRILLGRGLDIFQHVPHDTFSMTARVQELRPVKSFSITYLWEPTTS